MANANRCPQCRKGTQEAPVQVYHYVIEYTDGRPSAPATCCGECADAFVTRMMDSKAYTGKSIYKAIKLCRIAQIGDTMDWRVKLSQPET